MFFLTYLIVQIYITNFYIQEDLGVKSSFNQKFDTKTYLTKLLEILFSGLV